MAVNMLLFLVLGSFYQVCFGIAIEIAPTNITRIVSSTADFQATATNVSSETTLFIWFVGTRNVANVTYSNGGTPSTESIPGYRISADALESQNASMNLTIENISLSQTPTEIKVESRDSTASAILNTLEECGSLPAGFSSPSCSDLGCSVTTEPQPRRGVDTPNSPVLYSCFNKTTCGEDAKWSEPSIDCEQTSIACDVPGKWGPSCANDCGEGCHDPSVCNFTDGGCTCRSGYLGNLCNELDENPCPVKGFWGKGCDMACGEGCPFVTCHRISAQCIDEEGVAVVECKLGFIGSLCNEKGCPPGLWHTDCSKVCGNGCPSEENQIGECNFTNGNCVADEASCEEGYRGLDCQQAICNPQDCNGGTCVAPGLCQLCPYHFASGNTCRNIRLDGFLKGSLSTFAILTGVIIFLSFASKWYIRRKIKVKNH